jgi:hypothetical protein
VTTARFRRESWWQIYFPVLAVALLSLAAVVLLAVLGSGNGAVSVVGDYSLILIIIPALLGGALLLALLIALVAGVIWLILRLPPYANVAQQSMQTVYRKVDQVCNRIAGAVIAVRSAIIGLETYLKQRASESSGPPDA